jgi:transcriptional regulator with XRE-family HTH domain
MSTKTDFKTLRLARSLTQEDVAYEAGVSIGTIRRMEKGLTWGTVTTRRKVADALGVTVGELTSILGGEFDE